MDTVEIRISIPATVPALLLAPLFVALRALGATIRFDWRRARRPVAPVRDIREWRRS